MKLPFLSRGEICGREMVPMPGAGVGARLDEVKTHPPYHPRHKGPREGFRQARRLAIQLVDKIKTSESVARLRFSLFQGIAADSSTAVVTCPIDFVYLRGGHRAHRSAGAPSEEDGAMAIQNKRMMLVCAGFAACNLLVAVSALAQDVSFEVARNFPAERYPGFVAGGDFNGDGGQDLAVADGGCDSVS